MAERVWEPFLTEQDKAHVAASGHRTKGFGTRPALLMIDLYRWVFGDRPQPLMEAIKEWPASCGLSAWDALPHIQSLLGTAREVGIPVVHVTGLPEEQSGIAGWASNSRNPGGRSGYMGSGGRTARNPGMYDIVDEVAPIEGEAFLRKSSPSPFYGTPIDITSIVLPELVNGDNVLAVGVWNAGSSSDLVIVPQLTVVTTDSVVRGPYLQQGTPNEITVRWRTAEPTDSEVHYGPAPGQLTSSMDDPTLTTEH